MIGTIFFFLFSFSLGVICSAFFVIHALGRIEEKVARNKEAASFLAKKQLDRLDKEQSNEQKKQEVSESEATGTRKAFIKVFANLDDIKTKKSEWIFAALTTNMLFQYKDDKMQDVVGICRLDGCTVDAEVKKLGKKDPIWKSTNPVVLSSETRDIFPGMKTCYIYFKTGQEMEEWYYALDRASKLSDTKKENKEAEFQRKFFSKLGKTLTNRNSTVSPDWLTAILTRIFWNINSSEGFVQFVLKKIRKKISKVEKPGFVADIQVTELYFGPEVPIFKNFQLLSVSDAGAVKADAEVVYNGGFHLTLEITFIVPIPRRSIYIPAVLSVNVEKLAGKIHFHCDAPPANCFWLGFYGEPICELTVDTEIGENYKLKQIPKLAKIIVNKIKEELIDLMVLPHMDDWPIPKIPDPNKKKKKEALETSPAIPKREAVKPQVLTDKEKQELSKAVESTIATQFNIPPINSENSPVLQKVQSFDGIVSSPSLKDKDV